MCSTQVLTAELTAINQYFIHAKMCRNWGYHRLAAKVKHESIDEMKHADSSSSSASLYLEGVPNLQRLNKVNVGETVPEQLQARPRARVRGREAPQRRRSSSAARPTTTAARSLLRSILVSEEEHIDWLEAQISLIAQLGVENYLAQQIREG
jgi:bacterioferritin